MWWVYVIQSLEKRPRGLPGFHYVGSTTDPFRRIRQHNGEIPGGGRYTSKHQPWRMRAIFGPYDNRSEALRAEYCLKHSKRGTARVTWSPQDSDWCRGLGPNDPRVAEINAKYEVDQEVTMILPCVIRSPYVDKPAPIVINTPEEEAAHFELPPPVVASVRLHPVMYRGLQCIADSAGVPIEEMIYRMLVKAINDCVWEVPD